MIRKAILSTTAFTTVAAVFHGALIYSGKGTEAPHYEYLWGYLLLFILTAGLILLVDYVKRVDDKKAGLAFLVASTVKMFIALGYLVPNIMGGGEQAYPFVINFIFPYFLFLIFELYWVFRILRAK